MSLDGNDLRAIYMIVVVFKMNFCIRRYVNKYE